MTEVDCNFSVLTYKKILSQINKAVLNMKNIVIISVLNRDVLFLLKFKCEETDQSPFLQFSFTSAIKKNTCSLHVKQEKKFPHDKYMHASCK